MTKAENYQKQKMEFLDSLQPDDFRNGGSFNQAEIIIDDLNKEIIEFLAEVEFSYQFLINFIESK